LTVSETSPDEKIGGAVVVTEQERVTIPWSTGPSSQPFSV
jgi:hypothetical protein